MRMLLSAISIALAGCGSQEHATKPATESSPVAVQTVAVATHEWPTSYEATGTLRAMASTTVSSKWMGHVREVKVQVGSRVRAGESLVVLDARDLETSLRRAGAAREEVRAAMPEADARIAAARSALDLSRVTFSRMKQLHEKRSISNQELDEASARLLGAEAAHDMARARRAQLDAKLAQTDQEVRAADIAKSYAEILAPFAGVVTEKTVEPGMLAAPGVPLLTLERDGGYRLEAQVEESRLTSIRVGQAVQVQFDGIGLTIAARVAEIVPTVDAASRSTIAKVELPALANLRAGMFGRATFALSTRTVLTIPQAAVLERGQLQSVLTAADGIAVMRVITTGQRNRNDVEVLSGLREGERVIYPAPAGLANGARVEVRP